MRKIQILLIASLLIGINCQGQNLPSVDLTIGYGFPESFHIGGKIHTSKKSQFGLYYGKGLFTPDDYSYNSFTLSHQFHFGKTSDISKRRIWYFLQGLTYGIDNSEYSITEYLLFKLSIGREFYISPRIGLSGDLGLFRSIIENETIKNPDKKPWIDYNLTDLLVIPAIRFQINYSLY